MAYFEAARAPGGARAVSLRLGQITVELRGLSDGLATVLLGRYAPFAHEEADPGQRGALRVSVGREPRDYFIEPPERGEFNPVRLACEGRRVRFMGYRAAGWFDTEQRRGQLLLSAGDYEPEERAVENYVRAAVAWLAAEHGGALVHGASAVWRGRGYLFFGPSGIGKSTLSACNRRARVVSDDLSLLAPAPGGGLELVGSPFRGTYEGGEKVLGRFPLRAGFRLVQDDAAAVREVPRVRALGELVGNLPFVAEAYGARPDLFARVEQAFAALPLYHLHFRKDDSYWDAIEARGLAAGPEETP